MKILIVTYFFLSVFSIFSSNYSFNFKEVERIPSSIQCYDYGKLYDETEKSNNNTLKFLNIHFPRCEKTHYCLDLKHSTGVCLDKVNDNCYTIGFSDGDSAFSPLPYFEIKPFAIGVNKNIIVYLTLKGGFYMTIITPITDKYTLQEKYFNNRPQQVKKIDFDEETNVLIKEKLCACYNSKIYCFPGNEGEFYFTFDAINKKEAYLLTIEKNDYAILIDNENDNFIGNDGNKASDTNETFFKKYLKIKFFLGLCLNLVIMWGIAKFLILK